MKHFCGLETNIHHRSHFDCWATMFLLAHRQSCNRRIRLERVAAGSSPEIGVGSFALDGN
jgi:hypothetical protein